MIVKKPSIFIYTYEADYEILKQICAGIEEEGVFWEVKDMPDSSFDQLAYLAANDSMLGSGIGINQSSAALMMRGLKKGCLVESYHSPDIIQCRKLGANSARAIKKLSFK